MDFLSPLRYPGGKGKLSEFMLEVFRRNDLCDGVYVEPYAGGAAVGLALLLRGIAWEIVINDVDRAVYAFWWAVLNEPEQFMRAVVDTTVDLETWQAQKDIYQNGERHSLLKLGFATFFLNRTNRSGILNGGVIGGKDQAGKYTLDARYNRTDLVKRIERIAQYKSRIRLHNSDALTLLAEIVPSLPSRSLIYLDPPYYSKGSQLYTNFYHHDDHASLAQHVRSITRPWIVTYDSTPEIHSLYSGERCFHFQLTYTAHLGRPKGGEVMYYHGLSLPDELQESPMCCFVRPSSKCPLGIRQMVEPQAVTAP